MPSSASSAVHRDLHSFPTRRSSDLSSCSSEMGQRLRKSLVRPGDAAALLLLARTLLLVLCRLRMPVSVLLTRCSGNSSSNNRRILTRSEEHTSELQSLTNLVCRLLLPPPSTEIYTLSLHDALPISAAAAAKWGNACEKASSGLGTRRRCCCWLELFCWCCAGCVCRCRCY